MRGRDIAAVRTPARAAATFIAPLWALSLLLSLSLPLTLYLLGGIDTFIAAVWPRARGRLLMRRYRSPRCIYCDDAPSSSRSTSCSRGRPECEDRLLSATRAARFSRNRAAEGKEGGLIFGNSFWQRRSRELDDKSE